MYTFHIKYTVSMAHLISENHEEMLVLSDLSPLNTMKRTWINALDVHHLL